MFLSRRASEWLAVGICLVVLSFAYFEIISARMPVVAQQEIESFRAPFGWVASAAIGFALLCGGVGSLFVTAVRLMVCLHRSCADPPRVVTVEHLLSSALVIAGFILVAASWMALS